MERGNRRLQYLIVSAVSSSAVSAGVSFSWATPVLPKFADNEVAFSMNNSEISWLVAISSIGYVIGSCAGRTTSDRCGRRISILGSSVPLTIGTILIIFAWEAWMVTSGRFLSGIGTGMLVAISVMYIVEIADKEIRGSLSLVNRFMLNFGGLLVISVGAFASYNTLNYMLLALPMLSFAACWWIPESPYFLLKEERVTEARKTIQMLTGIRDEDVLEEKLAQMQAHVRIEMTRSDTIKEFLTGKQYRKAIFIVAGMKVPQILTGLHTIQVYLGPILQESKSGINLTSALIIFGAVKFLLGIISSLLVDRLGRRPLLISSFFGTGVVLAINAVYFGISDRHEISYPYNLTPFVGIIMALIIAVLGYESVAYIVPAELFPLNVRAIATAVISVTGGIMNFLIVKSYQQGKDLIGLCGVFVVYAVASIAGAVFCYYLLPETKGKSLKEIQIELNGNIYDEEQKLNPVAEAISKVEVTNETKTEQVHVKT